MGRKLELFHLFDEPLSSVLIDFFSRKPAGRANLTMILADVRKKSRIHGTITVKLSQLPILEAGSQVREAQQQRKKLTNVPDHGSCLYLALNWRGKVSVEPGGIRNSRGNKASLKTPSMLHGMV